MSLVRRHLRRGVATWLLCHALTFTALVPRDCCAAHSHATHDAAVPAAADGEAPCHEVAVPAPAPGALCEMAAEDGAACPMHAAPASPLSAADCALSGSCQAPAAALAAVLMQAAVLSPSSLHTPHLVPEAVSRPPDASPRSLASPPDAPPPRA